MMEVFSRDAFFFYIKLYVYLTRIVYSGDELIVRIMVFERHLRLFVTFLYLLLLISFLYPTFKRNSFAHLCNDFLNNSSSLSKV